MKEKKDLRVIKTQNLLYETLLNLLKNHAFEDIKVSDICNNALINRSTFYAHYPDKYELLLDLINNLKNNLLEELEKNEHIINTKEYYMKLIKLLFDYIDEKKDTYYNILVSNRNSIVMDILLDVAIHDVKKRIQDDNLSSNNIPSDIVSKFYIGAVVSIVMELLQSDNKYSKEDYIDYLDKLIPNEI